MAEAQQAIADGVVTELELGMTFLDVAETTRDRKHARQSVRNAIIALRTANAFLRKIEPGILNDSIRQRQQQLTERLRAIIEADGSGGNPKP